MRFLHGSFVAGFLVLAACGGGDDPDGGSAAAGTGGQGGAAGSTAQAGKGGASGVGGGAGAAAKGGASGTGGTGGAGAAAGAGAAGASGAGAGGSAGAGKAGAGGSSGSSGGTAGGAGKGGSAGAAGAAGKGGSAGAGGASGAGAGGSSGAGAGGSSGAGAGGSSGAGAGGSSGAAGAAGAGGSIEACPGLVAGPSGHLTKLTLTVKGVARGYSLDVPTPIDPAVSYPVVFVLHGDGGTGEGIRGGYGFASIAPKEAIFVYPDALPPARSWNVDTPPPGNEDIDLFDALLAALPTTYCTDASRVFAAGMSRGGFFANRLGCDRGDKLRAIAPHSGSLYASSGAGYDVNGYVICQTDGPAVIQFHGAADVDVPLKDGVYARDQWVHESSCGKATTPYAPSPCVAYSGCEAAHPVVWCQVPGLAHAIWSQAPKATWSFFASLP